MDDLSISSDLPKNQRELSIELKKKERFEARKNCPSPCVVHIHKVSFWQGTSRRKTKQRQILPPGYWQLEASAPEYPTLTLADLDF